MVTLAQRLEKLRMGKGISRIDLANVLGLPKMSIEKFETGKLTPSKDQQEKLAAYFGVSVMYLKGESDDPNDMASWLNGNIKEEPVTIPTPVREKPAKPRASEMEDGAIFNLMLKSDAFKAAVLDVLKTPEGQKILANIIKQELRK